MGSLIGLCLPAVKMRGETPERKIWSGLAAANGLISLLWLASTLHYNQAFSNPGGVTLFALHVALTAYCRHRYCIAGAGVAAGISHGAAQVRTEASHAEMAL